MSLPDAHGPPVDVASSRARLADYRDAHRGETVLVCGCGESLNLLEHPERFVTIGVNDVGRLFTPDYLVICNGPSQFSGDRFEHVRRSKARALFTQIESLPVSHPNVVTFRLGMPGGCDFDDPDVLHYTQNSPYVAVCLAVQMGARRIGLVGVDFTDRHFFAETGRHPLAPHLEQIDTEYARLREACEALGVELFNLSRVSRLTSLSKVDWPEFEGRRRNGIDEATLKIVSYATTPIAGVPLALAWCIRDRTPHDAHCVWRTNDYGNGVSFDHGIEWEREERDAQARLRDADAIILHNGRVDARHAKLLEGKAVVTMAHNYMWNVDPTFVDRGFPGVVVGQYQATLPEFSDWAVVPNPIPFWDPAYACEPKPDRVTICFTPSGQHECYPRGHRLFWHAKGYRTTLDLLERLARSLGVRVETVRDGQVPHAESLAMKRRAHVVIDECVTGSYHRNSLEGLAAGCVVVNGVGLLPGVIEALGRCAPGAETLPFVHADLGTLERVLTSLVELGPEVLARRGLQNRRWLERHWDFRHQWREAWEPVLTRARGLERPKRVATGVTSVDETPRIRPLTPRRWRTGVSVVLPHGGQERLPHLEASLADLDGASGVGEVIVSEMGVKPHAADVARRFGAKYVFTHNAGIFERARTLNVGSALAECELVLWKDNDLLLSESFIERAATELRLNALDHLLPYTAISYLTEDDTRRVLDGEAGPACCRPARVLHGGRDVSGGAALVRAEFLLEHGGIPDVFRGWGGEDNAWIQKARLLGRTGVTGEAGQQLYHLYHPDSGAHWGRPTGTNPHYARNVQLLQKLKEAHSGRELEELFPDSGRKVCPWPVERELLLAHTRETTSLADAAASGLRELYAVLPRTMCLAPQDASLVIHEDPGAVIVFGDDLARRLLDDTSGEKLWRRLVVVVRDPSAWSGSALLSRAGSILANGNGSRSSVAHDPPPWPVPPLDDGGTSNVALATALAQPVSLVVSGHPELRTVEATRSEVPAPDLPLWLYWEGPCPAWIRACRESLLRHGGDVRLVGPEEFDSLWDRDRDLDLTRLHVAHRADFVRAFLLARHGGVWLDSDCILMRSVEPVRRFLRENDFVAHRDRQGYYPNGFMAARRGSVVVRELYDRVCRRLRSAAPLGWISLGGELLTDVLETTSAPWREMACDRVQPVCWSRPEIFFTKGTQDEHEQRFDERALCYMMSNTETERFVRQHPSRSLFEPDTFFRFLLDKSMSREAEPHLPTKVGHLRSVGASVDHEGVFERIYRESMSRRDESVSGPGSCLAQTEAIRAALPSLLAELDVCSVLDAPCGDFHWLKHVELGSAEYVGVDIVADLVARNQRECGDEMRRFLRADLTADRLPRADLVLCRDCLVLFSYADARRALRNLRRTGATYLLTTTFPGHAENLDAVTGAWRPLNLTRPPFCFPPPLFIIDERCTENGGRYADKSLGLWRLADVSSFPVWV